MSSDGAEGVVNNHDGNSDGPIAPISLVDHTQPLDDGPSEPSLSKAPSNIASLSKTFTQGSLRKNISRRKYQRSRWQEGKGSQSNLPVTAEAESASTSEQLEDNPVSEEVGESTWGQGRVERHGRRVKDMVRVPKETPRKIHTGNPDARVDILYENQRGFFFFGIPRFSSNSLLNFDPSAWLDARFHPSAVDITNAQVPDPSWEWTWRTWYVDMSGDVDEEGWEYSFWFGDSCAWHGTHPWFHSFVRRRRWLRKRTRRKTAMVKDESHALTGDYFTIHSQARPSSPGHSAAPSEKGDQYTAATSTAWGAKSWDNQADTVDIANIPDLMRGLRRAAVDRQKIIIVRNFLNHGGEELHYLSENMETIMKMLVFQNSRRQLLAILMHEFEAAEKHRDEHERRGEAEQNNERQHIDNLLKAVEAADEQCKHLEYWSDVREMAQEGEILGAADHTHGWSHEWQGVDNSGARPENVSSNPSEDLSDAEMGQKLDKGKGLARKPGQPSFDGSAEAVLGSSADSAAKDVFYSPEEERSEPQAMRDALSTTDESKNADDTKKPPSEDEHDDHDEVLSSEEKGNANGHGTKGRTEEGEPKAESLDDVQSRPTMPERKSWIEQAFF